MRLGFAACVLALAVVQTGCASSAGTVFEPHRAPSATVPARIQEFSFWDARRDRREGSFDTPIVSLPGDGVRKSVQVSKATIAELQHRLDRLIHGGTAALDVHVLVTSGAAGWDATWSSETASAAVSLEVVFKSSATGVELLRVWGDAWGSQSSLDVADDEPNALFHLALLAAFDRAVANDRVVSELARALADRTK